jgi:aspartate racemase
MRTIGLIGGTSWYSTIDYYRVINETVNQRLGNNASAKILLYSVNFEEIASLSVKEDWDAIASILIIAARKLEVAGAECLLLCANTMHICADQVQEQLNIPVLHIADVVVKVIEEKKLSGVLLLGTRYTMLADFYPSRLQKAGIRLILPPPGKYEMINTSIYNELGKGIFMPSTKQAYIGIIHDSVNRGAEGVILGCTELPLLLNESDVALPLMDTTVLHATAAVDFALR